MPTVETEKKSRDLLDFGRDMLSPLEKFQIGFVRRTLEPGAVDNAMRGFQRTIGANWIEYSIRNLRHVHGFERVPKFERSKSYICVSNHRSFFDLYVVTAYLVKHGMHNRMVFPVRANFFYDQPLGLFVNGVMSFFSMYPPVFRERNRAALNLAGLDELIRISRRGGAFIGLHPEGQRKKDDDPYSLLPAQSGVGRIIQKSNAVVIPVFINGLNNDIVRQVMSNYTRTGGDVNVVFGAPIDFGDLLEQPSSPRTHKRISEKCLEVISALGQEEKQLRDKR